MLLGVSARARLGGAAGAAPSAATAAYASEAAAAAATEDPTPKPKRKPKAKASSKGKGKAKAKAKGEAAKGEAAKGEAAKGAAGGSGSGAGASGGGADGGGKQGDGKEGDDSEFSRAAGEAAAGAQFAADEAKKAASRAGGLLSSLTQGLSLSSIAAAARDEFEAVFMSPEEGVARKRPGMDPRQRADSEAGSALVRSARAPSAWERLRDAAGANPIVDKVRSSEAYKATAGKVTDMANDMRERWETSDSAMVHAVQDYWDQLSTETEKASAQRIAREREPGLSFPDLVAEIREQIPSVLSAHATGDVEAIKPYCAPEVLERLEAEKAVMAAQGGSWDPQVLDVHDVSLFDVKLIEDDPIVIVHFVAQQVYCMRDDAGNIVEGAEDDIREFYYAFVYAQDASQEYDEETGEALPRWKLLFMALQGTQKLVG